MRFLRARKFEKKFDPTVVSALSILFMRFCDNLLWNGWLMVFAFNSLYEIPWSVQLRPKIKRIGTFNSLYEIPAEEDIIISQDDIYVRCYFQFSL